MQDTFTKATEIHKLLCILFEPPLTGTTTATEHDTHPDRNAEGTYYLKKRGKPEATRLAGLLHYY